MECLSRTDSSKGMPEKSHGKHYCKILYFEILYLLWRVMVEIRHHDLYSTRGFILLHAHCALRQANFDTLNLPNFDK